MGGVDRNDAVVGNYTSVRKTYKWTTKVGIQFIEDAYTVYRKCGESGRFLDFKLNVIDALLARAEKAVFDMAKKLYTAEQAAGMVTDENFTFDLDVSSFLYQTFLVIIFALYRIDPSYIVPSRV